MGFGDIFRKAFLEGYAPADITTANVVITMVITCAISLYIFMMYRLATKKVFYSLNFNISLVATALITATIIFTIQSSVVISLGMVGALSIVRFRTAIKDPLDLVFLFWAISVGIVCGAGFAEFAVILSLLLSLVLIVLSRFKEITHPRLLVINATDAGKEEMIIQCVKTAAPKFKIKSRAISTSGYNMVIELRLDEESKLPVELGKLEGVVSVSLVSHDGEVTY